MPVAASAEDVGDIKAVCRHGQTFVTWKDAAEGEAGARYRYSLYRSEKPIGADLAGAELCFSGVLNNSAKLYGAAFNLKDRLDPAKPTATIEEGGTPLPLGSGLAVVTVAKERKSYYAIVVTDEKGVALATPVPGKSATTEPVDEKPAFIRPIKLHDSKERKGPYTSNTSLTGKRRLPLQVTLHGSQANGGGAGEYGDYYLFFGSSAMGYRDGLPGVFSVEEHRGKDGNRLMLRVRDAVEHPGGARAMETYWFGYACVPQWARHAEARFYPFTETRLLWIVNWVVKHYDVDPDRITMGGSSSGAVGSMNVGFRHPDLFAAVYPSVGRVRKVPAISLHGALPKGMTLFMADGTTAYDDRADGPKFAAEHHEDLPFLGWACGRRDGYATWQENIDMVKAMTAARHGFAFSWNNGDHSGGGRAMQAINKYYPAEKFARKRSYPAFSNSSIDDKMGNGDPKDGDLEGGINLGFDWKDVCDDEGKWSVRFSNELALREMTVDVTPRRCQKFRPKPGEKLTWTDSAGRKGEVVADRHGLVTVTSVRFTAGMETKLQIARE